MRLPLVVYACVGRSGLSLSCAGHNATHQCQPAAHSRRNRACNGVPSLLLQHSAQAAASALPGRWSICLSALLAAPDTLPSLMSERHLGAGILACMVDCAPPPC